MARQSTARVDRTAIGGASDAGQPLLVDTPAKPRGRGRSSRVRGPTPEEQLRAMRAAVRAGTTNRPGVYRMLSADGEVVYVGKSKRLRSRLLSYFRCSYPEDKGRASSATHSRSTGSTPPASSQRFSKSCGSSRCCGRG